MSALETARNAYDAHPQWGAMPEWVGVLAQECDLSSQSQVAKRIGRSFCRLERAARQLFGEHGSGRRHCARFTHERGNRVSGPWPNKQACLS